MGSTASVSSYTDIILADRPIGYWKLDETEGTVAKDSSGKNHDGKIQGGVKLGEAGIVRGSRSAGFDGATGCVELPAALWRGGAELTVEAWINVREASADFQAIVSSLNTNGFVHLQLHSAAAMGSIGALTDAGVTPLPGVAHTPLGVWRHLALVASPGKTHLYVDGQLLGTSPVNFSKIHPASAIHIGNGYQGGRFFKGHIGEVAVYDHALSPERIQARVGWRRRECEICEDLFAQWKEYILETGLPWQTLTPDLNAVPRGKGWKGDLAAVKVLEKDGAPAIELSRPGANLVVWLDGLDFREGTIEFDAKGKSGPRRASMVGVAFHTVDAGNFDSVYFRPYNFRSADAAEKAHAVQYASEPLWRFDRLREPDKNGQYENPIEPAPDGDAWFHVKVVLANRQVKVFVNGAVHPSLAVSELTDRIGGSVGLWAFNYGVIANLKIVPTDASIKIGLPPA